MRDPLNHRNSWKGRIVRFPAVPVFLLVAGLFLFPGRADPWGGRAHRWINRQAFRHLPEEMAGFKRWAGIITAYASEADRRKTTDPLESPRHFIDIDRYPEFHQGRLSHDLDSLKARYGDQFDVYGNGVVPWTVASVTETLWAAMAAGRWPEAILRAADLGHYVADGHQPLHTTENYDGQLTGNDGVHLRYEIHMVDRHLNQLPFDSTTVSPVSDPLDYFFETIPGTWIYVDSIMAADRRARKHTALFDEEYYRVMWELTGRFTVDRLCQATRVLAALWLTAWVNAGRPTFPLPPQPESIAGLQPERDRPRLVAVQGVVTLGPEVLGLRRAGAYLQDGSGKGISLVGELAHKAVSQGDLVVAEGFLDEYEGTRTIVGPSISVMERGHPLPQAPMLTTSQARDPRWDDTLIRIGGSVVFLLEDRGWTRVHLNDGSGAVAVMIADATGIDRSRLREGDVLRVCGVGAYLEGEGERVVIPGCADQVVMQGPNDLDSEDVERLKAIGYID